MNRRIIKKMNKYGHNHIWINTYHVQMAFGGNEEGGWWYDTGEPMDSIKVRANSRRCRDILADKKREADIINMKEHSRDYSSVLSTGKIRVYTEDQKADYFPKYQPHYE